MNFFKFFNWRLKNRESLKKLIANPSLTLQHAFDDHSNIHLRDKIFFDTWKNKMSELHFCDGNCSIKSEIVSKNVTVNFWGCHHVLLHIAFPPPPTIVSLFFIFPIIIPKCQCLQFSLNTSNILCVDCSILPSPILYLLFRSFLPITFTFA